jgi:hypothetical protein
MQQLNTFQDQCLRLFQERRTKSQRTFSRRSAATKRRELEDGDVIERDESAVTIATTGKTLQQEMRDIGGDR